MKKPRPTASARPIEWKESHAPFVRLIDFCVRGHANPALQSSSSDDHAAELCLLLHNDIGDDLWPRGQNATIGSKARELLDELAHRAVGQADEKAANLLYSIATEAAYEVLFLYLRRRKLFTRISSRRKLLPCLLSIHPHTAAVTARMRRDARLGEMTDDAKRIGSRAWFSNDAPANVYARAIIACVDLNRHLEPIEKQLAGWSDYDKQYHVQTVFLPFPKYVAGLAALPTPITPASVPDYWRIGKEIIQEEMPEFHKRPEWQKFQKRQYASGAKTGSIQHAIFKDILAALRTIAGANKGKSKAARRESASNK